MQAAQHEHHERRATESQHDADAAPPHELRHCVLHRLCDRRARSFERIELRAEHDRLFAQAGRELPPPQQGRPQLVEHRRICAERNLFAQRGIEPFHDVIGVLKLLPRLLTLCFQRLDLARSLGGLGQRAHERLQETRDLLLQLVVLDFGRTDLRDVEPRGQRGKSVSQVGIRLLQGRDAGRVARRRALRLAQQRFVVADLLRDRSEGLLPHRGAAVVFLRHRNGERQGQRGEDPEENDADHGRSVTTRYGRCAPCV